MGESLLLLMEKLESVGNQLKGDLSVFNLNGLKNWLQNATSLQSITSLITNTLLLFFMYFIIRSVVVRYAESRRLMKLQGKIKVKKKRPNPLLNIPLFIRLYDTIMHRNRQKGEEEKTEKHFMIATSVLFAIGILFIFFKQYLLAVVIPLVLTKYLVEILISLEVSDAELVQLQLPRAIDNILKVSTRYGDTRTVLYEAARTLPQPIRSEFQLMVRKMNSQDNISVLNEFKQKYNDIWVRSFIFIMVSMQDDSERHIALDNLKNLRDMLNNENNLKMAAVTSNKLSVNTNYTLAGLGAVMGFLATMIPSARNFYFTTPLGLVCFIGGYALILATVKLNIRLSSLKDK